MLRVTLDANIYVSALEFGGVGARLLGMARAGMIRIDVSDAIVDELVTVLREDPDDNRILECALEAGSEFIVTIDKDLLRVGDYGSIRIVTASQLLALYRAS